MFLPGRKFVKTRIVGQQKYCVGKPFGYFVNFNIVVLRVASLFAMASVEICVIVAAFLIMVTLYATTIRIVWPKYLPIRVFVSAVSILVSIS